ncbi:hypothetical protein P153DRAFT_157955 [Dothidotthia symphoricarpi CBS 119687]|uniref:Uncharacterized protein n=1 Tax=Dothidotthia symphoricarpi CBS 119687 TaxID=1392245 RepID=A0A6A6ANK9_9PLEO|nr:uncharacterized protein P153DRAFT_157955 [Dothidotthia symphoricarpi CBS 119687]KAF2133499.1 hypothetical protein P153DRAFT_157955 [Dothidotthia symphoricarpi CBS 119687]
MEKIPSPLQTGAPASLRRLSTDSVPSSLRVGSPAVERGSTPWDDRPPLTRKNTSGRSDRLSQLFPSRPSSIASPSPPSSTTASRRTSYPSPLVPAAESPYRVPHAPAPPSFAQDTSYKTSPFVQHDTSQSLLSSSGSKRLLDRLVSLRGTRTKGADYFKLEDEESGPSRGHLKGVKEVDEPVGFDLSGLSGMSMRKYKPRKGVTHTADAIDRQRDLNEAGYAAEFERLEAQLGAGMSSIVERPFTHESGQPEQALGDDHQRMLSNSEIVSAQKKDAQKEAEKTSKIVAVAEVPIDISESFAGGDFEARSMMTAHSGRDGDDAQTSYYFPPDPEQPSWRPFTMAWYWILMLTILAIALAVLQEFLCQLSMRRVRDNLNGGLTKPFKATGELSVLVFFTWKYAPIMSLVFYGILWQMTDFEVKRLEPFYQLSKKTGATAGESLNMDYLTFMSWLVPLRALRHRQYAVIYSSLGTLIASSLVPVLQSASIIMYPPKSHRKPDDWKSVRVDPPWSRAVSACLLVVAFLGLLLMYAMRRNSGLQSNPMGIAGVAAMATKSHILTDFYGLDTAPLDKIHKQLKNRRYILHKSSLWQGEYIRNNKEKIHEHGSDPRPMMLRLRSGVPFIAYMALCALTIPIFMFVRGADIITEKVPILMTSLATIVKLLWNTMNCDIRMLQPFYILAQRRAPAKTLTLDYSGTNPLYLPLKALLNRHYLVALVAFGSLLAEMLTVCVSSASSVDGKIFVPGHKFDTPDNDNDDNDDDADDPNKSNNRQNTDQTFRSFWSSFFLTMCILVYLIIVACIVYKRRAHKFIPRQIGTMASVLAFIHQSNMLVNFVDTEKFSSREMTQHLSKGGKTYALGWFQGRDGDDHMGIDEEPILARYRYGVDRTKTRMLGHQIGTWENY